MTADQRFKTIRTEFEHPAPARFPAKFEPAVLAGQFLYLSGEGPRWGSAIKYQGQVWESLSTRDAKAAAEITTLNLLFHVSEFLGSLNRIERMVEVTGFVCCKDTFGEQPNVLDGCSSMLHRIFGDDKGRHARSAIGVASLPLGICIEIKMLMLVKAN